MIKGRFLEDAVRLEVKRHLLNKVKKGKMASAVYG